MMNVQTIADFTLRFTKSFSDTDEDAVTNAVKILGSQMNLFIGDAKRCNETATCFLKMANKDTNDAENLKAWARVCPENEDIIDRENIYRKLAEENQEMYMKFLTERKVCMERASNCVNAAKILKDKANA